MARVDELLAAEEPTAHLTASLCEEYPHTRFAIVGPDGAHADDEYQVWDDDEPNTYPLEQHAQSYVWTLRIHSGLEPGA